MFHTCWHTNKWQQKWVLTEKQRIVWCLHTQTLTVLGRFSLRKVFMSPPVMSSSSMKRGRICRLTPIQRTMFWWLNLLHTQKSEGINPNQLFRRMVNLTLTQHHSMSGQNWMNWSFQMNIWLCSSYSNIKCLGYYNFEASFNNLYVKLFIYIFLLEIIVYNIIL